MRRGLALAFALAALALGWWTRGGPEGMEAAVPPAETAQRGGAPPPADPDVAARPPGASASGAALDPDQVARAVARLLGGDDALDPTRLGTMISRARDPELAPRDRSAALRWLARFGGPEALDVVERAIRSDEPAGLRAAAVLALGECGDALCLAWLDESLASAEPAIAAAAVRGLARRGDDASLTRLRALALDRDAPPALRDAAAAALGGQPGSLATLREALARARSEGAIDPGLLEALASQPVAETEATFRELLTDPTLDAEARVAVVEALGAAPPEAADLLAELAAEEPDPALRAAAAESLGRLAGDPAALERLGGLLAEEGDAGVRSEIYRALAFHGEPALPGDALLARVLAERSPGARLAGARAVASRLGAGSGPALARPFDGELVPWLRESAERGADRSTRRLALDALKLAGTPGARDALLDLSHSSDPQVAEAAERALRFPRR